MDGRTCLTVEMLSHLKSIFKMSPTGYSWMVFRGSACCGVPGPPGLLQVSWTQGAGHRLAIVGMILIRSSRYCIAGQPVTISSNSQQIHRTYLVRSRIDDKISRDFPIIFYKIIAIHLTTIVQIFWTLKHKISRFLACNSYNSFSLDDPIFIVFIHLWSVFNI